MCTAMLQDLRERGLRVDESILCVVDGGKGIRKALVDVLGDLAVIQRCQIHKTPESSLVPSQVSSRLRAPDDEGSLQVQECRQGAQATSGIGGRGSSENGYDEAAGKPSRRDGRDTHGREARAAPPYFASLLPRRTPLRISTETIRRVSRKRQAVEESFHDSPMDRSRASSRRRKSFTVSKAIAIWALSFHALRSKQKSLDSDEVAA